MYTKTTMSKDLEWSLTLIQGNGRRSTGTLFLTQGLPLLYSETTMADSMNLVSKDLEWTLTLIQGKRRKSSGMLFLTLWLPLLNTKTTMADSMN